MVKAIAFAVRLIAFIDASLPLHIPSDC